MKKAVIILVTILLAVFFCCELMAATIQKSIIPADAVWIIHFDVAKFNSTQIGEHLLSEEGSSRLRKKNAQFRKKYQIDLLKDIDSITVFGLGAGEKQIVACLRGNLNQNYLLGLLAEEDSHQEIPYGKYTIHNWDDDEYGVFADKNLALIGPDEDALKLTLDVIAGKKENISSSPMNTYLKEIPSDAFFAALVNDISSLAKGASKVFIIKKAEAASLSLMEKGENLNLRLNFSAKTLEDAKNMESVIRGLVALVNMQLEERKTGIKVPEDMNISTEGKKIKMEINFPSKVLMDNVANKIKMQGLSLLARFKYLP
jgi:hypothetical protein